MELELVDRDVLLLLVDVLNVDVFGIFVVAEALTCGTTRMPHSEGLRKAMNSGV